jgi:serine phosphatase RsbU (regulator of sigma subunit)/HAMP domain-containing protein
MVKSLRGKLIFFTTFLVIVMMVTTTYLFTFREIQYSFNEVETQMRRIAQNIATMQLLDRQEWEIYQNYITQLMTFNKDIVYIALYDARGNLRAHSLNTELLELDRPVTSRRRQAEIIGKLNSGAISEESVDDLKTEVVNIQVGDRVLGSVNVGFSVIQINDRLRERFIYMIVLSILFLVIFITISILYSRRLTRPLEKLTLAMRRINEGFLDQKVESESRDEIGQLSRSFNVMVEGLKERQIIDHLGQDLGSTFQFKKLTSLVKDRLRDAIGAKSVRLYLGEQGENYTFNEIASLEENSSDYPVIRLTRNVENDIKSEAKGFMIHDSKPETMKTLHHSADDEKGLILPMLVKGELFGFLFFALPAEKNSFSEKERRFAATLSSQVALAFENARLYDQLREQERIKRELEIAREVQQQLLPRKMPVLKGYAINGICRPAFEVGGDYFDFFQLDKDKLGFVIADVSGKGISASFYMAELKGIMMQLSSDIRSPRSLLIDLNRKLYGNLDKQTFISMIYGIIDPVEKSFTFARAGHNSILKLDQDGNHAFITPGGIGLGLAPGDKFVENLEESVIPVTKDNILIFYTDGITETMNENSEEFGEKRLLDICSENRKDSVNDIQESILSSVDDFLGSFQAQDDQTMIVMKCLE